MLNRTINQSLRVDSPEIFYTAHGTRIQDSWRVQILYQYQPFFLTEFGPPRQPITCALQRYSHQDPIPPRGVYNTREYIKGIQSKFHNILALWHSGWFQNNKIRYTLKTMGFFIIIVQTILYNASIFGHIPCKINKRNTIYRDKKYQNMAYTTFTNHKAWLMSKIHFVVFRVLVHLHNLYTLRT